MSAPSPLADPGTTPRQSQGGNASAAPRSRAPPRSGRDPHLFLSGLPKTNPRKLHQAVLDLIQPFLPEGTTVEKLVVTQDGRTGIAFVTLAPDAGSAAPAIIAALHRTTPFSKDFRITCKPFVLPSRSTGNSLDTRASQGSKTPVAGEPSRSNEPDPAQPVPGVPSRRDEPEQGREAPQAAPLDQVVDNAERSPSPSSDFIKWCRDALQGLSVPVDPLIDSFLALPLLAKSEHLRFIAETIHARSSTIDGRAFATNFRWRRCKDAVSLSSGIATPDSLLAGVAPVAATKSKYAQAQASSSNSHSSGEHDSTGPIVRLPRPAAPPHAVEQPSQPAKKSSNARAAEWKQLHQQRQATSSRSSSSPGPSTPDEQHATERITKAGPSSPKNGQVHGSVASTPRSTATPSPTRSASSTSPVAFKAANPFAAVLPPHLLGPINPKYRNEPLHPLHRLRAPAPPPRVASPREPRPATAPFRAPTPHLPPPPPPPHHSPPKSEISEYLEFCNIPGGPDERVRIANLLEGELYDSVEVLAMPDCTTAALVALGLKQGVAVRLKGKTDLWAASRRA